jgi:hypothetical protein
MSSVVISGDTSGAITVTAPAIAGTNTQTLVAATGTLAPLISETVKSATGTSVDFTGIPSWAKRITVIFSEVSTDGTSTPLIQLGDAGGIETTGYVSTSMQVSTATASSGSSTAGFVIRSILAANILSGTYTFYLIDGATYSWVGNGIFKASTVISSFSSGSKALSDTLTQIRITTANGTDSFDAGSINILYE